MTYITGGTVIGPPFDPAKVTAYIAEWTAEVARYRMLADEFEDHAEGYRRSQRNYEAKIAALEKALRDWSPA